MEKRGEVCIKVLGCRGSMPAARRDMAEFGGDTSCYQVQCGEDALYLDAGTGLMNAAPQEGRPVHILLSHAHADHILGLPMFGAFFRPGQEIVLYGRAGAGLSLEEQLNRLVSPPLWPCTLWQYPAKTRAQEAEFPLRIGPFTVWAMESCHPGGSLILKVAAEGRSIVYATDFEHTPDKEKELIAFSRGVDLLLYDAQYTQAMFEKKKGFGHSTGEAGLRVARESGVKLLRFIHHDPFYTDVMLRTREESLGAAFARQGEVIRL